MNSGAFAAGDGFRLPDYGFEGIAAVDVPEFTSVLLNGRGVDGVGVPDFGSFALESAEVSFFGSEWWEG